MAQGLSLEPFLNMKKILCFIDSLGSGGAQRQLVNLGIALKKKGHNISFLTYYSSCFFKNLLDSEKIPVDTIECTSTVKRIIKCRSFIRKGKFDVVISFLEIPSLINELAGLPWHRWKIIVGERSSSPRITKTAKGRLLRFAHLLANDIVSNSHYNQKLIRRANPLLPKKKCHTIYNIYDVNTVRPTQNIFPKVKNKVKKKQFKIIVGASHQYLKNLKNLAKAVALLSNEQKDTIKINWYGNQVSPCYEDSVSIVQQLNLQEIITFFPPSQNLYAEMINADAVGLFSLYEGLPNVICEAMCLGKPVIASDVSDNRLLIGNDRLICLPTSPQSIADSLSYILSLSQAQLADIGMRNRRFAVEHFASKLIVDQYSQLFR